MKFNIVQATANHAFDLSVMTGELLNEIMDKIQVNAFHFNPQDTERRAADLINRHLYFVFIAQSVDGQPMGFISLYESYALWHWGQSKIKFSRL